MVLGFIALPVRFATAVLCITERDLVPRCSPVSPGHKGSGAMAGRMLLAVIAHRGASLGSCITHSYN